MDTNPNVIGLMANTETTPHDIIAKPQHRGIFEKGDDMEALIIQATGFFNV